jgi:membrane protease YdiL (CAAX protease family)
MSACGHGEHEPGYGRSAALIALSYVFAVGIGIQSRRTDSGPERRDGTGGAHALFAVYIGFGFILFLTYGTGWTWPHAGVRLEIPRHHALIAGAAVFVATMVPCAFILRAAIGRERWDNNVARTQSHETTPFSAFVTCGMNPIMEELVFRGIAVHLFDVATGLTGLAISMGCMACILLHSYQGIVALPFHVAFYACSIAVLYSPLGLVGCMGLHFVGDLLPTLSKLRRPVSSSTSEENDSALPKAGG